MIGGRVDGQLGKGLEPEDRGDVDDDAALAAGVFAHLLDSHHTGAEYCRLGSTKFLLFIYNDFLLLFLIESVGYERKMKFVYDMPSQRTRAITNGQKVASTYDIGIYSFVKVHFVYHRCVVYDNIQTTKRAYSLFKTS